MTIIGGTWAVSQKRSKLFLRLRFFNVAMRLFRFRCVSRAVVQFLVARLGHG